jgi:hypothetical protein
MVYCFKQISFYFIKRKRCAMSRAVRLVPGSWEHPRDAEGKYIPLLSSFPYNEEEIQEGLADGSLSGDGPHYGRNLMPEWSEEERTHLQMYETTTEGTPISPVMETAEGLARWLADNKVSAWAGQPASYSSWLEMIQEGGWAPSACMIDGKLVSGVSAR